jgi:acetoin utilization protein AcuB
MMESHNIHHLPVTDDGAFVSVITARDVKFAMAKRDDDSDAPALTIASVCEDEVYVVDLNSRLDYVLFEMAEKRIGSAVVLKADKLAGIFTVSDACRTFAEFLQLMFPDGDGDIAA